MKINHGLQYRATPLRKESLNQSPFLEFSKWFKKASALYKRSDSCVMAEPNAMALSTASPKGLPSSRYVLLKEYSDKGFVFYTSYKSNKGKQLEANPRASLLFYWAPLHRQVRIEGRVKKVAAENSDRYFNSRFLDSRIGAAASPQSRPLKDRQELVERFKKIKKSMNNNELKRPSWWGGYILIPKQFEFWQGQANRLHDRFLYKLSKGQWEISRLGP